MPNDPTPEQLSAYPTDKETTMPETVTKTMKTVTFGEINLQQTTSRFVEEPPAFWQCIVCGDMHLLSHKPEPAYSVTIFGRGGGYCHIDCRPPTQDEQDIAATLNDTGGWVHGDSRAVELYIGGGPDA